MSVVSERLAGLSPEKRKLLELLLKDEGVDPSRLPIARRGGERQAWPLSFGQERLWFLDQLEPGTPLYNESGAIRLSGSLNVAILEESLNQVIRRHEVLRTTFATVDGEPAQVIAPSLALTVPVVDLRELPEAEREAQARRLAVEQARRPFDLGSGPLVRVTLLRLGGEEEHALLMTMHHIICDGWSVGVFIREIVTLYEAISTGQPSPLPELSIQYADFALWQRGHLQGEVLEAQLAYWTGRLRGSLPVLELPTDRPRPARRSFRGATQSFALPKALYLSLKELSRQEGVTLFMTLLAGFKTLLHRYTGQEDILVGSPIAGRSRHETEGLIGFFVNTLVLRTDLSGDPSFRELLGRVREVTLGAYDHQDLPIQTLVEALQPKRGLNRPALVQAAFALHPALPALMGGLNGEGLTLIPMEVDKGTAQLDLTLFMWEGAEELTGTVEYNTDLFDASTITRMLTAFQTLLEGIVADPGQPLSSLPCGTLEACAPRRKADSSQDISDDILDLTNLTKNQFLVWAGQKLQPEAPIYNMIALFKIAGPVCPEHFQKAFRALVAHTDALRAVIEERDGIPRQRFVGQDGILSHESPSVEYFDFSQSADPQASASLFRDWRQERSKRRLNFEVCLFDSALAKIAEDQFIWYLNLHHLIADGWSFSIIFRRLKWFYESSIEGRLEEPSPYPLYQAFVAEERAYRRSPQYLEDAAYWEQKLGQEAGALTFYGKAPVKRTSRVERVTYDLGVERTQKLEALARQEGFAAKTLNVSLFNMLAGVLAAWLYRSAGSESLSIGTPFLNRASKESRETVGLFMQAAPLRVTVSERDSFDTLIEKVKAETAETLRHQRYAVRNLKSRAYDVVFNFHNRPAYPDLNGAPVRAEWIHSGHENTSLSLQVHNPQVTGGSYVLHFDFHCDVFNEEQRRQGVEHFLRVLDALLEDSAQALRRVSLLSADERERLLVEFSGAGDSPYPAEGDDQTIPQLFEAQAQNNPDRQAVVCSGQSLTYAQLNARANQLAHRLRSLGVGPESLVGICLEPSPEAVVAMLGVLKAGGAYLPLDADYPPERLAFMLEDAQVRVLLTQSRLLDRFSKQQAHVICLDADWPTIAAESEQNPEGRARADNLAYVIYTSGSTGRAKGVMITHRGICNRLRWGQVAYQLGAADRALQKDSFAYDASVWEIFEPLLAGAQVVMACAGGRLDSAYLVELISEEKITVAEFVPSMLSVLLEEDGIANCDCLKRIFAGGEALPPELQERFFARLGADLYNTYGPTEASVDVTHWRCERGGDEAGPVPIGRPIDNLQVYLLDADLQLIPMGLPGELHIGGVGLARGYLNRPELTAEKFIPHPFSQEPGARLYKTGDLARYLPDGNLEFLGRIDHQVKLRGFRIELGEVEAALGQHPAVREAVVLLREDDPGAKRLVAYLATAQEPSPSISELRGFLKERLPEYMIPSAFVMLEALPVTSSGKVDRRALPAPSEARPELERVYVAPSSAAEETLAGIWAQTLKIESVGVHDNFFELGGDSILSIQVIAKANQAGLRLTPKQLFEHQTIAELAAVAGLSRAIEAEQGLVTGPVPLTPIQRWFFEQQFPDTHHYNQAILLEAPEVLNPALLERAVGQLLAHHDALRLRFVREDSGWKQVNAGPDENLWDKMPSCPTFSRVDLSRLPEAEQPSAIEAAATELQASLNLEAGPLLRVAHFDLDANRPGRLLLIIHHLAVDGVSWRILLEDLQTAYLQLSRGDAIQLPPKTTSFKQWAKRLLEHAQSEAMRPELDYWCAATQTHCGRLPVDFPGGANTVASARTVSVSLSLEETQALLHEVPQAYHTQINDVLLTALAQAFSEWAGVSPLLIDLEGHGREAIFEDVDLSRTVGWFTTIFPALLDVAQAHDPLDSGEALKTIKEQLRQIPNHGLGYGLLRYLTGERGGEEAARQKLRALPQAEVGFNYLGQFDQALPESSSVGSVGPFRPARESSGLAHSPLGTLPHLLEVNGLIAGGRLRLDWVYSESAYRRSTIERLAQRYTQALRTLIIHCQSPEAGGFTPSDFAEFKWNQAELDEITKVIGKSVGEV
jgi:amino acid adenylation domain-containing protein/non-ribosomal peptide synthase protein (TIGR01720 family)